MANRFIGRQRRYPRTVTRAATVTRRAAKAIVRRAGPLDRRFFIDSTLVDVNSPAPTTYGAASTFVGITGHNIINPADYQDELSGQERVQVSRLKMRLLLRATVGSSGAVYGYHRECCAMLVAGREDDLDQEFLTLFTNPIGTVGQTVAYGELTRACRVIAAKRIHLFHPPPLSNATVNDQLLSTEMHRKYIRIVNMRVRKPFWLKEPEMVKMYFFFYVSSMPAGTAANVNALAGNHQVMATFRRY